MTQMITGLEAITRVATLGFALVDAGTGRRVSDGLDVEAADPGRPDIGVPARCSRAGVWSFDGLPGMSEAERGSGDEAYWLQPGREFAITAVDSMGRYLPWQFMAQAPTHGLFLPGCIAGGYSPPAPAGIPLFPNAAAAGSAGLATVRAELRLAASGAPARRAVMEIFQGALRLGRGVADDDGRVAAFMPYPKLQSFPIGGQLTSGTANRAMQDQVWKVRIVVRYAPAASATLLPDLCLVLAQPPVPVWLSTDWSAGLPEQDLIFGRELTLQSIDAARHTRSPQLWVGDHP